MRDRLALTARGVLLPVGLALAAALPQASQQVESGGVLRTYLAPAIRFTDTELAAIDRGRPVGKVLPSRNSEEIFVLGVIHVKASSSEYLNRALDPKQLLTLPGYRGTGLIGDPPESSDFKGFTLEPDDVSDLRECEPGDCALQLPAAVMDDFRLAARNGNPSTAARLTNSLTASMASDLVRRYREQGNAALPTYDDERQPADVAAQFRSLIERFTALSLAPAETARLLLDYPHVSAAPQDLRSIFYWERVVFGLKPTLRVTHLMAYQPASGGLGCVVAIKQLYASHYIRAAIDFTACLTAPDRGGQPGFYLIAFKGSRQEGITGLTGSLVRRIVVGRARTALDGSLIRIKRALEEGSGGKP